MKRLAIALAGLGLVLGMMSTACGGGGQTVVAQYFRVEGSAMNPALPDGTLVKVLQYGDARPQRGDVVVFRSPNNPERAFIQRIIGEPGDVVAVEEGTALINNVPLDEPYVTSKAGTKHGPETVPADHYFVLGDNRANAYDSRAFGMIPEENIIGRVDV